MLNDQPRLIRRLKTLHGARKLLTDPKAWAKGVMYGLRRDDDDAAGWFNPLYGLIARGELPPPNCFCSMGAVVVADGASSWQCNLHDEIENELVFSAQALGLPFLTVPEFNDDACTTHKQVLNVFDFTFARLASAYVKAYGIDPEIEALLEEHGQLTRDGEEVGCEPIQA